MGKLKILTNCIIILRVNSFIDFPVSNSINLKESAIHRFFKNISKVKGYLTTLPCTSLRFIANYFFTLSILLFINDHLLAQTSQTITSSGTFLVPSNVNSIKVECWGGGGGGGYGGPSGNGMNGGGGGAYSMSILTVSQGNSFNITIGLGGTGGSSGNSGTAGGNTIFGNNLVIAIGGGVSNVQGTAALGGQSTSCTGDLKFSGGNGGLGNTSNSGGGGGGGSSASATGNGVAGSAASGNNGGAGGNGPNGDGGNGGNHSGATTAVGTSPGGGGGGRGDSNGNSANGAKGQVIVTWTICPSGSPIPTPTITANYCIRPGYIRLTANGGISGDTYFWSTSETSNTIDVNIAGRYFVTITNSYGCSGTASYDVSTELVVDGSFTNFNASSPFFITEYTQQQSYYAGTTSSGLWPEGYYAVNTSAWSNYPGSPSGYHTAFHGRDHTNNSTGARNFLMVNGSTTLVNGNQKVIWQQTVNVLPNTNYYFSA